MSPGSTDPMRVARFAHEARFFVDMLQFSRLVLLFGEPGAGKTTLLRDWVIPALRAEHAPAETRHVVYFDAWDGAPLDALNAQIEATLPPAVVKAADTPLLRFGPWANRLAAWTAQPGRSFVLIFDHFDRYLGATASGGLDTFAREWIGALAAPDLRVQFLVAMRASAEPSLVQRFGGHIAALGDNRVVLPPPRKQATAVPEMVGANLKAASQPSTREPESALGSVTVLGIEKLGLDEPAMSTPAPAPAGQMQAPHPPPQSMGSEPTRAAGAAAAWPDKSARPPSAVARPPLESMQPGRASGRPGGGATTPRAARRPSFPSDSAAMRADPWFDADASAPFARAAKAMAEGTEPDPLEDDLFGPEPAHPPEPVVRKRRIGRTLMRWFAMVGGVAVAVLVSAVLLVPASDLRIPLRAQAAAALNALNDPFRTSVPATAGRAPPGESQAPPSGSALPPLPRAESVTSPRETATVNAARTPARAAPLASGAHTMPAKAIEVDGATAMARDVGKVLAASGAAPPVRAGIGATAASGPRARSDLFIARYDVLDAMRSADSGDSRNVDGLRLLLPLQVEPIYFAVRSDDPITFVHQIADLRINLGAGGTDAALGAAHLYRKMFDTPIGAQRASYMPDAEALTALMRERSVDVVILVGRAGFSALAMQQRATPGAFKLLTFDPSSAPGQRVLRSYLAVDLAPSAGSTWFSHRLPALAVMSFLVGRGLDEERTGQIVHTLCEQRSQLRATGHPYWQSVGFGPVNAPGWRYAASAERELRACSARWSSAPEAQGGGARPMVSQLEFARAVAR